MQIKKQLKPNFNFYLSLANRRNSFFSFLGRVGVNEVGGVKIGALQKPKRGPGDPSKPWEVFKSFQEWEENGGCPSK